MLSVHILDLSGFGVWTTISQAWAIIAGIFIITVPLVQEVLAIAEQARKNKSTTKRTVNEQSQGVQNKNFASEEAKL